MCNIIQNEETWLEKYRPKKFKDYLNYNDYRDIVKKWIKPFLKDNSNIHKHHNKTSKPFLILYGPPSYGKTTLAHCIFNEYEFEPLECNASDTRNRTQLEKRIKTGKTSFEMKSDGSGFKPYGLILDELDGLTTGDNGGVDTIMKIAFISNDKLIKNNEYTVRYPIICTTNSIKEKKLLPILKFGELIIMTKPSKTSLFNLGKQIIKNEKIPMTQKLLKDYIKEDDDYRSLIYKLNMIYIDIKTRKSLIDKKRRIEEIVNREKSKIVELRVNNSSIFEIAQDLMLNLGKYNKGQVLNVIDANNLVFYFTMITNYRLPFILNNSNLLSELINKFYYGNKFLELFKKNKNDYNDLIKYINYIISYGSIFLINNNINNNIIKNNKKNQLKLKYHTKYNDMKQDKSYFFNNIQYKFNIVNSLDNDVIDSVLYNKKVVAKKQISNNTNIMNNIIDLDILFIYEKLGYSNKETGLNKTIYTKIKKYITIK
jgi:DNA polymerase III delta prime subunit